MPKFELIKFEGVGGKCYVQEFLDDLPPVARSMGDDLIERLCDGRIHETPKRRNHLEGPIHELKWSYKNVQYRITYCCENDTVVLFNAFIKKTEQAPRKEIDLALERYKAWRG